MELVDPLEFVPGGVFREKEFREKISAHDWARYQGKPVLLQGCSSVILPVWAFLVITSKLVPVAKSVSYGELSRPIPVSGQLGSAH